MTEVLTPRRAFGDVSSTRLQGLASSKNRQNAIHETIKANLALRHKNTSIFSSQGNNLGTPNPYLSPRKRGRTPSPQYIDDDSDNDIGFSHHDVDPCIWSPKRGKDNFGHALRIKRAMRHTPHDVRSPDLPHLKTNQAKLAPFIFTANPTCPGAPKVVGLKTTPKLINQLSPTTGTIFRIARANSGRKTTQTNLADRIKAIHIPSQKILTAKDKNAHASPLLPGATPLPFSLAKKALGMTAWKPALGGAPSKAANIARAADAIAAKYAKAAHAVAARHAKAAEATDARHGSFAREADFQSMAKGVPFMIYEDRASEMTSRAIDHDSNISLNLYVDEDDVVMGDEDKENVVPQDHLQDTAALAVNAMAAARARQERDAAIEKAGERGVLLAMDVEAFAPESGKGQESGDLDMVDVVDFAESVNKSQMARDVHAEARRVAGELGFSICEDAA